MNNKATYFTATIEYLHGQSAAIVCLTDGFGGWAGAGRIEVRSGLRSDLYEAGYRMASLSAMSKGGRLETYKEVA